MGKNDPKILWVVPSSKNSDAIRISRVDDHFSRSIITEFSSSGGRVKLQAGPISTIGLFFNYKDLERRNIARGTTDPEIDSVTWIKLSNNKAPLALVANLATRWRHLHLSQIWPPDGTA